MHQDYGTYSRASAPSARWGGHGSPSRAHTLPSAPPAAGTSRRCPSAPVARIQALLVQPCWKIRCTVIMAARLRHELLTVSKSRDMRRQSCFRYVCGSTLLSAWPMCRSPFAYGGPSCSVNGSCNTPRSNRTRGCVRVWTTWAAQHDQQCNTQLHPRMPTQHSEGIPRCQLHMLTAGLTNG